jgi:hypothetical protein
VLEAFNDREGRARNDGLDRPGRRVLAFYRGHRREARGQQRLRLDEADAGWAGYAPRRARAWGSLVVQIVVELEVQSLDVFVR